MTPAERFEILKKKYRYDSEAAESKIKFIEKHCRHVEGDLYGQPLVLPDVYKDQILRPIFGLKRPNGKRLIRTVYIQMPRKNAKALDLNTPIPTPLGWKLMGEIKKGDYVFGGDGKPTMVTATSEIFYKNSYEIEFQCGEKIVASEDHLWEIRCHNWRKGNRKRIVDTKYVFENYKRKSGENIFNIDTCSPVSHSHKSLLIDPYVLGCWLGDGHSASARITIGYQDAEETCDHIKNSGVTILKKKGKYVYKLGLYNEVLPSLKKYNLVNNKHIPLDYLQSSIHQRIELLKGLMDTDGTISKSGQCKFTGINRNLVENVYELVLSLGIKATWIEKDEKCQNGYITKCYNVCFFSSNPVFKLQRKLARQKKNLSTRSYSRSIIKVVPVGKVFSKCITIDNENKLFLAGKHFIPTHNSTLAAAIELVLQYTDGENSAQIYNCAGNDEQADLLFNITKKMVELDPILSAQSEIFRGSITYPKRKSFIKKITSKSGTKHGFNSHGVIYDELHVAPNADLYDTLKTSFGQRSNPMMVMITTPGHDKLSLCYNRYEYAVRVNSGIIEDDTFWGVIYEAPEGADIYNEETWEIGNPLYNYSENLRETIRDEAKEVSNDVSKENTFRRLRLGQWTSSEIKWMKTELWTSLKGEVSISDFKGMPCWLGLDRSSTQDLSSLCVLFEDDGFLIPFWYLWISEESANDSEKKFMIPYSLWEKGGHIEIVEGNTVGAQGPRAAVKAINENHQIVMMGYDEWNTRDLAIELQEELDIETTIERQGFGLSVGLKKIKEVITKGNVLHSGNPVVTWTLDNVMIKENDELRIKIVKPKDYKKIDPWVSFAMAVRSWIEVRPKQSVYLRRGVISI